MLILSLNVKLSPTECRRKINEASMTTQTISETTTEGYGIPPGILDNPSHMEGIVWGPQGIPHNTGGTE